VRDLYDHIESAHPARQLGGDSPDCIAHPPNANANWKNDTAADPAAPKQWCITLVYESLPLSFALMTTSRIVLPISLRQEKQ
jgi:hypothetical protein